MAEAWTTVVQRESEWDETTVKLHLGLVQFGRECCPGCGLHQSILDDPEHHRFTFQTDYCSVCKASAAYMRVVDAEDTKRSKALGKNPSPRVPRPGDGRHIRLRRKTAEEG